MDIAMVAAVKAAWGDAAGSSDGGRGDGDVRGEGGRGDGSRCERGSGDAAGSSDGDGRCAFIF